MLDNIALFVIVILLIMLTAAIVYIGSMPGKIARSRNHPHSDAVNAASWIGLATGVLWPLAFIWAFLPVPVRTNGSSTETEPSKDLADLQKRLTDLEAAMAGLQSQPGENSV